jgi:hypothetical protein
MEVYDKRRSDNPMLTIRKAQMDALGAEMVVSFEERVAAYLRETFPAWSAEMGRERLAEFVRHGVARAPRYGFAVELDVVRYVVAMQALGMRFDEAAEHEWAGVLLQRRMPPGKKMEQLLDAVMYQTEARRIRDGK